MQESHGEGLAIHAGPESCADGREVEGEVLTGVRAGWVSSREMHFQLRGADAIGRSGRPHGAHRQGEMRADPARSKTPGMHGNTTHGNREIPRLPAGAGRIGKSKDARR